MKGRLTLDQTNGYLAQIEYAIDKPVKLEDGTTVTQYNQTYDFGYSERWGVSYVTAYEVEARGGAWGVAQSAHHPGHADRRGFRPRRRCGPGTRLQAAAPRSSPADSQATCQLAGCGGQSCG